MMGGESSACAAPGVIDPLIPALSHPTPIILLDDESGHVALYPDFVPSLLSATAMDRLGEELQWSQHLVHMFGRQLPAPRLSAWHGAPQARYRYSGACHEPQPWTPMLSTCLQLLNEALPHAHFNSVLANLYRDGRDSMGWHADDERELGPQPQIASLSFGAPRNFLLRERCAAPRRLSVRLEHGSLLLMSGATQHNWQHALPRRLRCHEARINLTFRRIIH